MKLKPVGSPNLPVRLFRAFIDPELEEWYIREVVEGCLRTPANETYPDSHYVQWPDFLVQRKDGTCGIEASLSKASAWPLVRRGLDFVNARLKIRDKFANIICQNLPKGRECGLYIVSQTDEPVPDVNGTKGTLLDLPRIVVAGEAEPNEDLDVPAGLFSFKPLQGALAALWSPANTAKLVGTDGRVKDIHLPLGGPEVGGEQLMWDTRPLRVEK